MAIEQTSDKAVALYDSVTGIAFGPVFEGTDSASPEQEADAFVRWVTGNGWTEHQLATMPRGSVDTAMLVGAMTPGLSGYTSMADLSLAWRTFLEMHDEATCPFDIDRDSYGIGYTGDSDVSMGDWTEARPTSCGCECHSDEQRQVANGQKARR